MSTPLSEAWNLVESGRLRRAVTHLRRHCASFELADTARLTARVADAGGAAELARAARGLADRPGDPRAQYAFALACARSGLTAIGVPALEAAARAVPGSRPVRFRLAVAYEEAGRHAEAVALLRGHGGPATWPARVTLVRNELLAGRPDVARAELARLDRPAARAWRAAYDALADMLARADLAAPVSPLDGEDLRGWQFVISGTVLGTLAPYAFDAGMRGRYAYVRDSAAGCLRGLRRLRLLLEATGRRPATVSVPPDRDSRILGRAAGVVLGLPVAPFAAGRTDTVVVAYDLAAVDPPVLAALRRRPAGQVLHAHATSWANPPPVPPDSSALVHLAVVPPWGARPSGPPADGEDRGGTGADEAAVAEAAAGIVRARPRDGDENGNRRGAGQDGRTPPDGDDVLAAFAAAVAPGWATGPRHRERATGPVRVPGFS